MLLTAATSLTACSQPQPPASDDPPTIDSGETPEKNIITPQIKDYDRRTIDFDRIEYVRPNADALISEFLTVTDVITKNEIPYADQLDSVISLEDGYTNFRTMYSYSNILMSEDARSTYWCDEYDYISGYVPSFSGTIEKLYVAAAQSEHAEKFEDDYFGEGLIEEYADGGIYTEALIALLEEETKIENRYSAISTANVVITYKNITNSFDGIMDFFAETYGESSLTYSIALEECTALYEERVNELSGEMLVDLVKVRRRIADELGCESYADFAYENIYHDYTSKQLLDFVDDVAEYIVPVYYTVSYYVIWPYFGQNESCTELDRVDLINTLHYAYEDMDEELKDIYSYMLQFNLYNVASKSENRFDGSFCTYLEDYDAPYIFLSADGSCEDYMALSHEFGHFVDAYINNGAGTSLDLSEVSSQALEYLTLIEIEDDLSKEDYKYLFYSQIKSSFEVLLFQSFYALFEHYAYDIAYDSISEATLIDAMKRAAKEMGMSEDYFDSLDHVLIPHIMLYPFYVQSYPVSASVALEIYYTEKSEKGAGLEAYLELIDRGDGEYELEKMLENAGLASPFSKNYLKHLADTIHYDIMGSHFYKESEDCDNAA